jgi:hypothetical protein
MDDSTDEALGKPNWTAGVSHDSEPKVPKVDHLNEIAELARNLHNVSPSGAETVRDKILQHIAWIREPKVYDEHVAREKKAHDEAVAASKKAKEEAAKAREAEKVYVKVA